MKIAYYIHHTTISAGGIFTYSIGILRLLINASQIDRITIITSPEVAKILTEYKDLKKIKIRTVDRKNSIIKLRMLIWFGLYLIAEVVQEIIRAKKFFSCVKNFISKVNPYQKILNTNDIELLHVPIQYAPIYKLHLPIIVTMHDLQEYHFPHYFSIKERLHRFINNKISLNDSDQIVVSFNHVKNDIVSHFRIAEEKISVCPPPFANDWFVNKSESEWNNVQTKYKIGSKYILYPAATWEHKNHLSLLKAVKQIRDEGLDIALVCTGNQTKYYETIHKRIEELKLSECVHFLGIVPEGDLISFYKNSSLVVIPTFYEAGSGPLYEAMRYRVPVICSNVTSLPDTVGNDDFLFDPNNVDALAKKIKIGLKDENFRQRNVENSKTRIQNFRNIDYSKNFIKVYKKFKFG